MTETKEYLKPKEIWKITGIKVRALKEARLKKQLKDVQWSPGKRIPYLTVDEVRKLFPNAK